MNKHKPKRRKPIRRTAEKRIVLDKIYTKLRKKFLEDHPRCVARLNGCTGSNNLTIQHTKGRVGRLYLDTDHWIPLCLNCHRWVNEHPREAIELRLAVSRLNKDI